MKYLVIIANGLTDDPVAERDNKTPLQMADTPNLDLLTKKGRTGYVHTIPDSLHAGNDVSYLSLLGYKPEQYQASPARFEAVALNVKLNNGEIPLCCDFVILQPSHNDMVMKDYTADQLAAEDANVLLDALQKQITGIGVTFHSGGGYHNLMVAKLQTEGGAQPSVQFSNGRLTPPNELIGDGIRRHLPGSCKELIHIINQAQIILHNHAFNKARKTKQQDLVNSIWLWGNGSIPGLPSFTRQFQKTASLITASNLLKGMALLAGIRTVQIAGATGFTNTNYKEKVDAALRELETHDVVYLQISAAEEASLHGDIDDKIMAIEDFDSKVAGRLLNALEGQNNVKILLVVNQVSSVIHMKYKKDPVPFVVYPAQKGPDPLKVFDEEILRSGAEQFRDGPALMQALFRGDL